MPFPEQVHFAENGLLAEELSYDKVEMKRKHEELHKDLNAEQLEAYDSIVQSVVDKKGGVFFVYGSGGCGKTYLWNTICCQLGSIGRIVLPVASSGITATRLPGGRTAHSRFHIPLKLDQYSVSGVRHGSDLTKLIKRTDLII